MRSSLRWLLGGAIALVIGSSCYWLVGDPVLAAVTGVVWGVGLAFTARAAQYHPSSTGVSNWESARWIGLGVAGINLAALIGVSPSLPISAELRLALGLLIIGTGLLATATATLAEKERQGGTATTTEPDKATTAEQSIE